MMSTHAAQAISFVDCTRDDSRALAELRARAMEPSLRQVGRFDEQRVRSRFLDSFVPQNTKKILVNATFCGFFVVHRNPDHLYLDHLYIDPDFQGQGLGRAVIAEVVRQSQQAELPIRLGALRESRANEFYRSLGFKQTHEDAFDIFYEYTN